MRFLNPFGLLGLFTIPVIIGLHLHLERNRRVVVSSMFLWSFLDARFEGERPKFIRLSWLLLLDVLIAAFISLAFARPVMLFPSTQTQIYDVVILLDDSTSMLTVEEGLERFSLAKELASSLVREAPESSDTLVVTVGGEVEIVGSTREMERRDLEQKIGGLAAGGNRILLRDGLSLASAFSNLEEPVRVFVLTDASYEMPALEDFPLPVEWVFLGVENNNQAVLDPILQENNQGNSEIYFQVVNYSGFDVNRELVIVIDGIEFHRTMLTLPANSSTAQTFLAKGGVENLEVVLIGTDAFPLDDSARLGKALGRTISVALVATEPYPLDRAVEADPDADLTLLLPEDYSPASDYDLFIFRNFIPDDLPTGTAVIFDLPSGNALFPSTRQSAVGDDLTIVDHQILNGINLNAVRWGNYSQVDLQVLEDEGVGVQIIVNETESEDPILLKAEQDGQETFLFTPELRGGNFTSHPAFPILISNLIEYSRGIEFAPEYSLGESLALEDFVGYIPSKVFYPGQAEGVDILGVEQVNLNQVGFYTFEMLDVYGRTNLFTFGVNAGDLSESNIAPQDWRVNFMNSNPFESTESQIIEVDLSPWLLAMATILLVVEAWRAWR